MTNIDQVLWKKFFYRSIEVLRNATVGVSNQGKKIRGILATFLEKTAEFYATLLKECERVLNLNFEEILPFKDGFPVPALDLCTEIGEKKPNGLTQVSFE